MDEYFMRCAIELAKKGEGFTNPNPLVGAVIVKDGKIIGEGYHEYYGGLHAERNAIKNSNESTEGAQMYVTLEPCSHYGKQPPCTEAIVDAGIKTVYIGSSDPNPLVSGRGVEFLRSCGVQVITGVLKAECDSINEIFFKYITTGKPYVIVKAAMTIDGKTAAYTGDSKWITNEKSRENVHKTRKRCAGIMVGVNTVLNDDPILNCRCDNPSNPIRIICDSNLRIPLNSTIMKTADKIPTIIATVSCDKQKIKKLLNLGAEIITAGKDKVDLNVLFTKLGERKIDSVLVEGGATLNASIIENDLCDMMQIYIAPKVLGGSGAKTVVGGTGVKKVAEAYMFDKPEVSVFGDDILLEYRKKRKE